MREPPFWWRAPGFASTLLAPAAALYGRIAAARLQRSGTSVPAPVICIGNPTVGGAGKTPAAIALAGLLQAAGERPWILSRGYGGSARGPLAVDPQRHTAAQVGDEPLLLARVAPTIVARDRVAGAHAAIAAGASILLMDDGFQNPSLTKDLSILVIDGRRGIGNGRWLPAGPLRAPLAAQLARAQALLIVGDASNAVIDLQENSALPVFGAWLDPLPEAVATLKQHRVLAFAGIGDPEKFFVSVRDAGIAIGGTQAFGDHHRYTAAELAALTQAADRDRLTLLTTEKDHARLQGDAAAASFVARVRTFPVTLRLESEFEAWLLQRLVRIRADLQKGL